MTPFYCIILRDRKILSLHFPTLCIGIFAFKMTTEIICLQDEVPIVLITTLDLETFIKDIMCTKIYGHQNKVNN